MSAEEPDLKQPSRRSFLKAVAFAPLALRAAPLHGLFISLGEGRSSRNGQFPLSDYRLSPRYPTRSPLEDVLRRVPPGSDEFITEKYASELGSLLQKLGEALQTKPHDLQPLAGFFDKEFTGNSLTAIRQTNLRSGGIEALRRTFSAMPVREVQRFLREWEATLKDLSRIETADLEITSLQVIAADPLAVTAEIRYSLTGLKGEGEREQRVGTWNTAWKQNVAGAWTATKWQAGEEVTARGPQPCFEDVTAAALGSTVSYQKQLQRGADYWRTTLDGACGIDVYGNNGVATGDYDNDGFDDIYVCQGAGLPNRLYRNRGDGSFEDVTEKAGVGVLDGTACALFADLRNSGHQDLLVVCGSGPLLFLNQGDGTFSLKRDAFHFKTPPQGTFTHAAIADYDRDGHLDVYFCLYSYYVGLDQYHYPVPYFDARNGPPNFLMHNRGDATFEDHTEIAGLNADNDRYSFACAWGDFHGSGSPDLYVANDFGRANLYRNQGDGRFAAVSTSANVEDVGAGMSAAWADYDNDGRQDIYSANMWSAAGQRISEQRVFHQDAPEGIRALYQRHARGNALYRNQGDAKFTNVCREAGVEMGRWSWCSDFWDFDHDGYADLYVANGYISAPNRTDLGSFFWRQVVGKSPNDTTPTLAYEHGWQALNELIRADSTWNGYERNVMFANNRDGTFSEVSGVVGLDFPEDSRAFALADLDHDGRLELVLKNRNAPQLRILHNSIRELGHSIIFRLRGTRSNRDAIGAAVTLEADGKRQTLYLQAGSGFLAQHSKELVFGVGKEQGPLRAIVRWPSGLTQTFENLPVQQRVELEEGSPVFSASPFRPSPASYRGRVVAETPEQLPVLVETWLAQPLKAPEFSLPDLSGELHALHSYKGQPLLLHFWVHATPDSQQQLLQLQQSVSRFAAAKVSVIAVNLDTPGESQAAHAFAKRQGLSYPAVFATEEFAGIYNIVYRYLFDRRRNLGIPSSFLLDGEGMIVKLYQGPVAASQILSDVREMPRTPAERMKLAIPFPGRLYEGAFSRNDFTYGVAMYQHGYLDQAAESFQQVATAKPDDPEAFYNLGTLNLRRKDYKQARAYLEQTLKLRPGYAEAWNNLGMMAAQEGHPDEAIKNFQQSLLLRPEYPIALLNLGNVYRRQGATSQAEEALTRALALQPDDPEISYSLGMFYAQQSRPERASEYLHRALALRPDYPEALNNLGVLMVRQRDYAQAEEQFKTCVRLVPDFDQSYLNLARLYALQGDMEKARQPLSELLRLQPGNAAAAQALQMLH